MPNAFAYFALLGWPLVAALLFRFMSFERALVSVLIGGHLLLPSGTFIDLPLVPALDKYSIPTISAALLALIFAPNRRAAFDPAARSGRILIYGLLTLCVLVPILTVLQNAEPVIYGVVFLPGLGLKDMLSLVVLVIITVLPFWLGLRYLNTREGHEALLQVIVLGAVAYTVPALIEIRLSPQLHTWIYGFFQHGFDQHIRDGGYRPVVFLGHGLMLGIFLAIATLAALVLYKEARGNGQPAAKWLVSATWLFIMLYVSKNLGALLVCLPLAIAILFAGRRLQVLLGVTIGGIVLLYPMLRGEDLVPVEYAYDMALSISEDRASSFRFRLDNEDALLARAGEKPMFGWGSWGRNHLYDPETGRLASVTDGAWIIVIGVYGWVGYLCQFGLLTVPVLLFALRGSSLGPSRLTYGLAILLAALLIDLVPNGWLVNYVWLIAGAVAGLTLSLPEGAATATPQAAPDVSPAVGPREGALGRADWLASAENAPQGRRSRKVQASDRAGQP